jgi:uncharacterized protein YcbK (DUF882 family)
VKRVFAETSVSSRRITRACASFALASAFVFAAETTQTAVANGDTRTLSFYHTHSQERITVTFKRDGRYDKDGLKKLNHFLRDWRNQKETTMEPRLFDVVWEVQKDAGSDAAIQIISAYRSPETNEKLRSRSKGVAKHSQHMLGRAMDIHVPDVSMSKIREAGLRLQRGGVGFYPTSAKPFVHLDVGSVRHWPRMSRDQLVRLFPDGRTVHLPTDGLPLKNYKLALADVAKNGGTARGMSETQIAEAQRNQGKTPTSSSRGFISKFLAGDDEDDAPGAADAPEAMPASAPDATPSAAQAIAEAVPMPAPRPTEMSSPSVVAAYAPEPQFPAGPEMIWRSGPASPPPAYSQSATTPAYASAPMPQPRPQTTPSALTASADRAVQPVTASLAPGASLGEQRNAALRMLGQLGQEPTGAIPTQPTEGDAIGHILAAHDAFGAQPAMQHQPVQQNSGLALASMSSEPVTLSPDQVAAALKPQVPVPSLSPVRTARNPDLEMAHPNFERTALIAAPSGGVLPLQFGGNPNSGMRSDAFMGSSVAVIRTLNFGPQRTALLTTR